MDKYLLAVLVDNKPGVLTHIAGLISRRAFNIESISAGYTEEADVTSSPSPRRTNCGRSSHSFRSSLTW